MDNKNEVLTESVIEESVAATCEAAENVDASEEVAAIEEITAVEFDEDEEFVPPIVFSDDYDDPVDDRDDDYYESNAARVRIHIKEQESKIQTAAAQAKKRTLGDVIQNFFYQHKTACLVAGVAAAMVAAYLINHMFYQ